MLMIWHAEFKKKQETTVWEVGTICLEHTVINWVCASKTPAAAGENFVTNLHVVTTFSI